MQDISVNKVVLIGGLDKEPELTYTQNGTALCKFRVITTDTFVNRDGQAIERKTSLSVALWGRKGEDFKSGAHATSRVFVEGSIRNRSYEDSSGNTRWVTEINAQNVLVLDGSQGQSIQGGYAQPQQNQSYSTQQPAQQSSPAPQQPAPVPQQEPPSTQPPTTPSPQQTSPIQQPADQQEPPTVENSTSSQTPDEDLPF